MPHFLQCAMNSFQNSIVTFHWYSYAGAMKSGQETVEVIQFGVVSVSLPAGRPAIATIFLTPSRPASVAQSYMDFLYSSPVLLGQSGLQDVFSAEMRMPRFSSSPMNSLRLPSSASSSAVLQCLRAPQPPAVISTASIPRDFTLSSMSV